MTGRPQTALAILALTPHGAFVLLTTAHLRLPRPPHPRGASRESSQAAAHALLRQLFPAAATSALHPTLPPDATPFLARDVPAPSASASGCRVITCPVALPLPPLPPPGTHWRPIGATGLADDALIALAHAATLSFGVSPYHPDPSPTTAAAPPTRGPLGEDPDAAGGMAGACARLRQAIVASGHPHATSWLDCVGGQDGIAMAATPPGLASRGTFVAQPHYRTSPLVARPSPTPTDPHTYPTNPVPEPNIPPPSSVQDLFTPAAWLRVEKWFRSHWRFLRDCATIGSEAHRGLVPTVVFTQEDLKPPFRGTIWDCRSGVPRPADFEAPLRSAWKRNALASLLSAYPDKELHSFVTCGTVSKSDAVGLVMVLGPHLQSLAAAFTSVEIALSAAARSDLCDQIDLSVAMFAFVPGYSIPQGTVQKKDGTDRRTSDYGHPRKPTCPPATPINVAIRQVGRPRERKPTNAELAHDTAVLRYAADLWGEDLFLISEDFKGWFNQFAVHPSDWFKQTFLWLRRGPLGEIIPTWLVEYVMGFGMSNSSGIAQRFSDALLWLLLLRFDVSEGALLDSETDPARRAYLADRARIGVHQAVLWAARCFTDDSIFAVVGADRTVRLLISWGGLLEEVGVVTKLAKRQAGCCIYWNGVFTNAFLANQTIPPDKILRAVRVLSDAACALPVVFTVYRKAMGLVTHIRGILRWRRMTTYGMFRPFSRGIRHPAAVIESNPDLRHNAAAFVRVLITFAGCSCADPPPNTHSAAAPYAPADILQSFFGYSDAALQGAPIPGLGGWLYGLFFSFPLPARLLGYPIVQLEFLGIILANIVFAPFVLGGRSALVSDSETSTNIVANDGAHTDETQWLHAELVETQTTYGGFTDLRHGHGESNPYADLASRGRLREMLSRAAQMGISATQLPIPPAFLALLERFEGRFGARFAEPGTLRGRPRIERPLSFALPPPHLPHDTGLEQERGDEFSCNYSGDGPLPPLPPWSPAPRRPTTTHPQPHTPQLPRNLLTSPLTAPPTFATLSRPPRPPRPHGSPALAAAFAPLHRPPPAAHTRFQPPAPSPAAHQRTLPPPQLSRTAPSFNAPSGPAIAPHCRAAPSAPTPASTAHAPRPAAPSLRPTSAPTPRPPVFNVAPTPASRAAPGRPSGHPPQNPTHATASSLPPRTAQRRARHSAGPGVEEDSSSPFAFDATFGPLAGIFASIASTITGGIPEGTLLKDDLAWSRWEHFCALCGRDGTPPWRTDRAAHSGIDPAGFNRESKLICGYLLWCYQLIQPRSNDAEAPKPQSAFNMVSGVRRIHKRFNIDMVSCRQISATLKGIIIRHIHEHGPESLLPDRKEPMPPSLVRAMLATPDGTPLGSLKLSWKSPLFLSLGTMFAVSMSTGFRKAEVALPNGSPSDDRRLRRASVVWRIDGKLHADPPPTCCTASWRAATWLSCAPRAAKTTSTTPSSAPTPSTSPLTLPTHSTLPPGCKSSSSPSPAAAAYATADPCSLPTLPQPNP